MAVFKVVLQVNGKKVSRKVKADGVLSAINLADTGNNNEIHVISCKEIKPVFSDFIADLISPLITFTAIVLLAVFAAGMAFEIPDTVYGFAITNFFVVVFLLVVYALTAPLFSDKVYS